MAEIQTKHLDMQLGVNLRAVIIGTREGLPMLREAGAEHGKALIVNTASIAGKRGQAWLSVYSATKAAVVGFSQATQKEVGGDGIQVTALCPGFVDTPMTEFAKGQVPAEEMIRPEDIAEAVRFLLRTSPDCLVPEIVFAAAGRADCDASRWSPELVDRAARSSCASAAATQVLDSSSARRRAHPRPAQAVAARARGAPGRGRRRGSARDCRRSARICAPRGRRSSRVDRRCRRRRGSTRDSERGRDLAPAGAARAAAAPV